MLPAIRGAQLEGFLDGLAVPPPKEINVKIGKTTTKGANPEYAKWLALDQQVLSYLLTTMTCDVMFQVGAAMTAAELWAVVEEIFSSHTRARAVNTRIALATTKKGAMTASEYIAKMKALSNEMVVAGKPLGDEELMSYVLTGLEMEYNPLVMSMLARVEPVLHSGILIEKLLPFKPIGEVTMRGSILFLQNWNLSSCVMSSCTSTKWCCRAQTSSYR